MQKLPNYLEIQLSLSAPSPDEAALVIHEVVTPRVIVHHRKNIRQDNPAHRGNINQDKWDADFRRYTQITSLFINLEILIICVHPVEQGSLREIQQGSPARSCLSIAMAGGSVSKKGTSYTIKVEKLGANPTPVAAAKGTCRGLN